jgi:cysteine desulfuration protein SufE
MISSCQEKQDELKRRFSLAEDLEAKYQLILDLGKQQCHLSKEDRNEENRVFGCQSVTYLRIRRIDDKMYFDFESDALISAGLGQLLSFVYNGETPKTVLVSPPNYLHELGIQQSLTPGRAQGLSSMYEKMRQEALKALSSSS